MTTECADSSTWSEFATRTRAWLRLGSHASQRDRPLGPTVLRVFLRVCRCSLRPRCCPSVRLLGPPPSTRVGHGSCDARTGTRVSERREREPQSARRIDPSRRGQESGREAETGRTEDPPLTRQRQATPQISASLRSSSVPRSSLTEWPRRVPPRSPTLCMRLRTERQCSTWVLCLLRRTKTMRLR